jgi:hypothetical protein
MFKIQISYYYNELDVSTDQIPLVFVINVSYLQNIIYSIYSYTIW